MFCAGLRKRELCATNKSSLGRTERKDSINCLLLERHSAVCSVCTSRFCFLQSHYKRVCQKKAFLNVKVKYKCRAQFIWDFNSLVLQIISDMFQIVNQREKRTWLCGGRVDYEVYLISCPDRYYQQIQ